MELKLIDKSVMLDHSVSGFFNQSMVANKVLSEFGFFLRFYERRNKFRFQVRQHLNEKNTMKKELSACVISKFNGYEFLRNSLKSKLSVFLHQKLKSYRYRTNIEILRRGKKIFHIDYPNNATTARTFLLSLKKKWKNICCVVQAELDLCMYLTTQKSSIINTTTKD